MFASKALHQHYDHGSLSKNKTLFMSLDHDGEIVGEMSFRELDESAMATAVFLRKMAQIDKGDRVLLMFPPGTIAL